MNYEKKLESILNTIFSEYGGTINQLSRDSGISIGTIYKLLNRETRFPQFRTR